MGNADNKLISLHQKNVRERLAELILSLKVTLGVKEEEEEEEGRWKIDLKLPREEMATMIRSANETLIRFFAEFRNAGIIEQKGKTIFINDYEQLLNLAKIN